MDRCPPNGGLGVQIDATAISKRSRLVVGLLCVAPLLVAAGCSNGAITVPGAVPAATATLTSGTLAETVSSELLIKGPAGCVDAASLPAVLAWSMDNVPADAHFLKAYAHDEEPTCDPTSSELRTQNDHLRITSTGISSALAEYDVFAFDCGREQINISMQVGTSAPQVIVALVVYHEGRVCPPPATSPPAPTPGTPPPAVCDVQPPPSFAGSGSVNIAQRSGDWSARVDASYTVTNFTGRVGIYWRNSGSAFMKTSRSIGVSCGRGDSGSLSWSSAWVNPSHGHVNANARYSIVFYTGSDTQPSIVWERRL
jgi:hypothetical protein